MSALEGGYRIQGGIVSAFARSVAAHVRALAESHEQCWDPADAQVPAAPVHETQERRVHYRNYAEWIQTCK